MKKIDSSNPILSFRSESRVKFTQKDTLFCIKLGSNFEYNKVSSYHKVYLWAATMITETREAVDSAEHS